MGKRGDGTDGFVVLYVDNTYTFGGAINALAHLVSALDRDRYTPIVVSAQAQAVLDQHFPGVTARHWPMKLSWARDSGRRTGRPAGIGGRLIQQVSSKLRAVWRLATVELPGAVRIGRFARRHQVDMIHLNNGVEGMLPALIAGKLLGIPVVAHSRGPQGTHGAGRYYASLPTQWVAVSGTMADNLVAAGVDPTKIEVVHDAIDLRRFERGSPPAGLRAELGLPANAPVFGVFGRIISWKGIREFITAAALVIEKVPEARALVVGGPSDGSVEYYKEMQKLAAELGSAEQVLFTGFRQDVADLMRLCDVVVHSSIVPEPFGMTVIEAMATGTPVVAADSGGPVEIIEPGATGVLADPRKPEEFATAISDLLRDPERAAAIGRRAQERAREHYSAERYARDVERIYQQLSRVAT